MLVHHMASEELFPSADDIVGAGFLDRLEGMDSGDHAFYHRKTKTDSEVGDLLFFLSFYRNRVISAHPPQPFFI